MDFIIVLGIVIVLSFAFAVWASRETKVTVSEKPRYWHECDICGKPLVRRTPDNPHWTGLKLCDDCIKLNDLLNRSLGENDPCEGCQHEGMACDVCPDHPYSHHESGFAVLELLLMITNAFIYLKVAYSIFNCF